MINPPIQLIFYEQAENNHKTTTPFIKDIKQNKDIKIPQLSSHQELQTAVCHRHACMKINTGIPVRMPVEVYSIHERSLIAAPQKRCLHTLKNIALPVILF